MSKTRRFDKAVLVVETASNRVLLEDLYAQQTFERDGVIDHRLADPFAVKRRVEKQSADLIAYMRELNQRPARKHASAWRQE